MFMQHNDNIYNLNDPFHTLVMCELWFITIRERIGKKDINNFRFNRLH
jgi:hypothetical protein